MAKATTGLNTRNQLNTDYEFGQIFIGENDFDKGELENATGGDVTYPAGTLLAKDSGLGYLVILDPVGAEGIKFPVGVLAEDITLASGSTAIVTYAVSGDINKDALILAGGVTLETVIDARTLADRIKSDTMGIYLVENCELSNFDNQ